VFAFKRQPFLKLAKETTSAKGEIQYEGKRPLRSMAIMAMPGQVPVSECQMSDRLPERPFL